MGPPRYIWVKLGGGQSQISRGFGVVYSGLWMVGESI